MKYVVVRVTFSPGPDSYEPEEVDTKAIGCSTCAEIQEAIRGAAEWSVWEVVDGRLVRRALRFHGTNVVEVL